MELDAKSSNSGDKGGGAPVPEETTGEEDPGLPTGSLPSPATP